MQTSPGLVVRVTFGLVVIFLAVAPFAYASTTTGTIDSTSKYAWGSVAGWINFAPTQAGLTVTDTAITGYAWASNTGWINFSPTNGGVTNDGAGHLGGYAWDESGGWVSFSGVTIDSSGLFHGQATGGTVQGGSYVINFDCTNCAVRTDWRPASVRASNTAAVGNGSPLLLPPSNPVRSAAIPPVTAPANPPVRTGGVTSEPPVVLLPRGAKPWAGGGPFTRSTSRGSATIGASTTSSTMTRPITIVQSTSAPRPASARLVVTSSVAPQQPSLLARVMALPAKLISLVISVLRSLFHAQY